MAIFVEDPLSRIVAVHWRDDDDPGEPGPDDWPCGAFRHGYGLYDDATGLTHYGEVPGNSIFILTSFSIYGIGFDQTPGHQPYQPYNYWWSLADYLPQPIAQIDVPYVWEIPSGWTITVDVATLATRLARQGRTFHSAQIEEFRNINVQALMQRNDPIVPDREGGATHDIPYQTASEIYPPGFRVAYRAHDASSGGVEYKAWSNYPPTLIQAHCVLETAGEYPPRPPQLGRFGVPYAYPVFGRNYWPIRPPPPPPYT